MENIERVIVAPHCDDETFACGGLLAKYPDTTAVLVLARPDEVREKEFEAARQVLGYETYHILEYEDGYVGDDMHALVGDIDRVLAEWQPRELYLPAPSMHQDHIAGYEAGIRSSRLSMSDHHWFPPSVLVYEVPVYDVSIYPNRLQWNVFLELDDWHIDRKIEAMRSYISQHVNGAHPVNGVKETAAVLGAGRALHYAEQFSLVRQVRA